MGLENSKIDFDEAINLADIDNIVLKRKENGMLLSNYQVSVLDRNNIDYSKYSNIRDLLFDIDECLLDNYDEELDLVSSQIAEFIYYRDTKK